MAFLGFSFERKKTRKKREKKLKERERQRALNEAAIAETGQTPVSESEMNNPRYPSQEEINTLNDRVNQLSTAEDQRQAGEREKYKEEAAKDLQTEIPGLSDPRRRALQETANKQINNQLSNYSRMLQSNFGNQGIRGGQAILTDLQRKGLDARNQVSRDLNELDADLAMQKLAAYLGQIENRSAQNVLQRQQFQDFLTGNQERRRRQAEDMYYRRYFGKV